jgi:hypothetical protein
VIALFVCCTGPLSLFRRRDCREHVRSEHLLQITSVHPKCRMPEEDLCRTWKLQCHIKNEAYRTNYPMELWNSAVGKGNSSQICSHGAQVPIVALTVSIALSICFCGFIIKTQCLSIFQVRGRGLWDIFVDGSKFHASANTIDFVYTIFMRGLYILDGTFEPTVSLRTRFSFCRDTLNQSQHDCIKRFTN